MKRRFSEVVEQCHEAAMFQLDSHPCRRKTSILRMLGIRHFGSWLFPPLMERIRNGGRVCHVRIMCFDVPSVGMRGRVCPVWRRCSQKCFSSVSLQRVVLLQFVFVVCGCRAGGSQLARRVLCECAFLCLACSGCTGHSALVCVLQVLRKSCLGFLLCSVSM